MCNFTVNEERRKVLGKLIERKRMKESIPIIMLSNKAGLEVEYIERLEAGNVPEINPLILMKIGEILEINYIHLYHIVGYVHNRALLKHLICDDKIYPVIDDGAWL